MKIFVDSANLAEIEEALRRGFPRGITTNPSILAKEKQCDFREHIGKIIGLIRKHGTEIPLSVEVFTADADEMVRQGLDFVKSFDYPGLNVKIPVGWDELAAIHRLRQEGVRVNCTCCMNTNQAVMAALAGADFVSLFYGRIRDAGHDAAAVIRTTREALDRAGSPSEIIVGSIRNAYDITDAVAAGAHIVTVPPKFLPQLTRHPKTDEAIEQFLTDFRNWLR